MTIASTQSKVLYAGNDSIRDFAIPFMFMRDEDIEVVLSSGDMDTVQTITTDYQLSGAGEGTGGACTMTTPPATGEILVIRREPDMVQEVDYVENDCFPAATHEAALDKLTMICQSLAERLDRTITFRVSSAVSGTELPAPEPGQVLTWNDAGDNFVNKRVGELEDIDILLLPLPISEGGTGAQTADAALNNLGFGTTGKNVAAAADTTTAQAAMDAEPADVAILKADLPDLLQAVYGDEAQVYGYTPEGQPTQTDLSGLTVNRNHIEWALTEASQFSDVTLPYDGTYVFHVYPAGHSLALAASYKTDGSLSDPDPAAGEIRIVVEQYNGRKTIVSLQNMEA